MPKAEAKYQAAFAQGETVSLPSSTAQLVKPHER